MNERAADLFTTALELPPDERAAFLTHACAGDAELRLEVDQLLVDAAAADEYFTGSFGAAAWVGDGVTAGGEGAGDWAGPFRLLRQLGEGGFGVVWLAEQLEPIRRKVAVKVIKAGMDSREVLARFAAERQALARMDHPNIARVLDAGLTAAGHPYFAMEWVDGVPINRFCDDRGLDLADRLRLFSEVCAAISHAHQKGVIHRDIKPANVLVALDDGKPLPKVIDFGIAKATEGRLTEDTLLTRVEQWIGTPVYMSPEQAGLENLDLDTRSDIYGLGVLLYELLTGVPPFDHKTLILAGQDEMRRIIREVEPQRPSARLGALPPAELDAIAKSRQVSPNQLRRLVDSDMDWIVVKAIEKTRDRRYDTAAALAADIGRFLRDEPVTAKPPSAFYLFSKFAKRHLTGLLAACGVGLLLVATAVFSSWQALRATKAEALAGERLDEAVTERNAKSRALDDADMVARFLGEVFKSPNPIQDGKMVTVAAALDKASTQLDSDLKDQPQRRAMLQGVLADTYEGLGLYDRAAALWQSVMEHHRSVKNADAPDSMNALRRFSQCREALGDYAGARRLEEEETTLLAGLYGPNDQRTLFARRRLATHVFRTGSHDEAITLQRDILERVQGISGQGRMAVSEVAWELIGFLQSAGRMEEAQSVARETLAAIPTTSEPPLVFSKSADSQVDLTKALEVEAERLAGPWGDPSDQLRLRSLERLAGLHFRVGDPNQAVRTQEEMLALKKQRYGEDHPETIQAEEVLIEYLYRIEQWDKARLIREQLKKRMAGTFSSEHLDLLNERVEEVKGLYLAHQFEDGRALATELLPTLRKVAGPEDRATLNLITHLARCYCALGRTPEGVALLARACPKMRDDTYVNLLLAGLQLWSKQQDDYLKTRRWMIQYAIDTREKISFRHDIFQRNLLICSLTPLDGEIQGRELLRTLDRAETIRNSPGATVKHGCGPAWCAVISGMVHYRAGNDLKAIEYCDESMRLAAKQADPDPAWERTMAGFFKALALLRSGREGEARTIYRTTEEAMKRWPSADQPLLQSHDAAGAELTCWLAFKEARELIDKPSPATEK